MKQKTKENEMDILKETEKIIKNNWKELLIITGLITSLLNGPIGVAIATTGAYLLGKTHQTKKQKQKSKNTQEEGEHK